MLVSRLPDRRALTRLVRAALRHEVAQVELTNGPQRADPHTLDLHVAGQPPLALLAEPAGPPQNGQFPLRLRPLYRAQAAQLYALLEAENVSVDGPPDTSPAHTHKPDSPAPDTVGFNKTLALSPEAARKQAALNEQKREEQAQEQRPRASAHPQPIGDSAPIARAMSGAAPRPVIEPGGSEPRPRFAADARPASTREPSPNAIGQIADPQVIQITAPRPATARSVAKDDPRRTVPSAAWNAANAQGNVHINVNAPPANAPPAVSAGAPATPNLGGDPRRTAPSATWGGAAQHMTAARQAALAVQPTEQNVPVQSPPGSSKGEDEDDEHGADADDASLSVSVVFEPEDMPAAVKALTAQAQQQQQQQTNDVKKTQASLVAPAVETPRSPSHPPAQGASAGEDADEDDAPADVEEPSLSVSVVFEPDALPPGLLRGVPSPITDAAPASPPIVESAPPATQAIPASDIPATIAEMGSPATSHDRENAPSSDTDAERGAPVARPISAMPAALAEASDDGGFFDDALANFPAAFDDEPSQITQSGRPPAASGDAEDDAPEVEASEPFEVQLDEVELYDDRPPPTVLDDDGLVPVPPPPDDEEEAALAHLSEAGEPAHETAAAAPPPDDDDDDDDDATLIRLPSASSMRAVPPIASAPIVIPPAEAKAPAPSPSPSPAAANAGPIVTPSKPVAERPQIVRSDARNKQELTPTQQTNIGQSSKKKEPAAASPQPPPAAAAPPPAPSSSKKSAAEPAAEAPEPTGRKKKSTRRKANANAPSGSEAIRKKTTDAESVNERDDDEETAALLRAPVKPPPALVVEVDEPPSNRSKSDPDPAVGRRIADGKYIIESLIGSGAAGAVYRATHRELRRTVAIKILHPHYQQDPHFMTSFRGEALAASQLDHPNVMRVLDFDQEPDGLIYIVMEYLSGRTLQSLLDEERRLPTERAVEIMIQVCAALSVAHDHGIIHRDIKPDNIMLVPSRNDEGKTFELVKVCDFGIAALQNPRAEDAELAASEHVIAGTPEYMSPEQARGTEIDARSDVYACGICLYELVTGRPPFLGDNPAEILIKQLEELPKPPSQIIKGLDPIIEEVILRATQKDPAKRHQSAREMRVELKELIEPTNANDQDDPDELSIVENVPMLDDPASGFPGFFIAFSSAILRFGRFERGHNESAQAMKELQKSLKSALRGRSELTFARRDVQKQIGFCVMSGTAEIVDLRRLLGSQLFGSFGEPFIEELVNKGIAALTLREGIPDVELHYLIEMLLGPFAHEDLRKELLSKPLRNLSVLFVSDVVGRDRKLSWKVGLCAARLARDLLALCNVRGISLKKMRETRDELIGGVARLLTRGDEVKQFIFNADLVDEAVVNLRGFSSFQVAPLIIERVLHESCAETATILLTDFDAGGPEQEQIRAFLHLFAQRLVTERSPKSDAAVAEFYRRGIITEEEMPRDLKESIRAQTLADALVREPSQFLLTLDLIGDPETYARELSTLEAAMGTLARRSEAVALLAVMSTLARHAKGAGKPGPRENAALRTMKSMIDKGRLLPIATTLLTGPAHQREAARQLIVIAGSVGAQALYQAREATVDPAARPIFVKVFRDTGAAGWTLLAQVLPALQVRDDAELALVEDLLYTLPDRADPVLGEAVSKFLSHPLLRATALAALVPLWGERARKPLVEALEYADEPTRIIALGELRRIRAIDEYVFNVIERLLTMRGSAGEELRAAAAAALADAAAPLRARAVQLLSKAVEGKRGFIAMLRSDNTSDESVVVMEAMGRALLALDRNEGIRALKGRLSRSEGLMKARLTAVLQMA